MPEPVLNSRAPGETQPQVRLIPRASPAQWGGQVEQQRGWAILGENGKITRTFIYGDIDEARAAAERLAEERVLTPALCEAEPGAIAGSPVDEAVALPIGWQATTRTERILMNTYVILRRSGWRSPADLQAAAERSTRVGDEDMSDDIRWIRSYVLEEDGGSVGTVCIYQASSPEAIREHASRADLPVDEIIAVADTVLVRPDPGAAPA